MGNRLTLPLLFLAVLLAGGAFLWMTGGERGEPERGRPSGASGAVAEERRTGELAKPEVARDQPGAAIPARVELEESPAEPATALTKGSATASVSGRVVDRFGTPVAGARVVAGSATGFPLDLDLEREFPWLKRQRTETDADGRFALSGVEPGSLQFSVRAAGFAPFEQRGVGVARAGAELEPFVLARGAILTGQVVDPEGRPVAGARILRDEVGDGAGFFMMGAREAAAETGADGRFRVDELACGAWRFVVRSEDHPDLAVEGLAEEPGVEQGGLRWQLAPGATIAGTVTGIPGGERDPLEVRALRGSSPDDFFSAGGARTAEVAANGSFLVRGLVVGENYTLQARRAEENHELGFFERSRSNSVQARSGDSGVVLAYQPEAALVFTVFDSTTRAPLERFEVEAGMDWPAPLRDEDGRPRKLFPGGMARYGGLRPTSAEERVQVRVSATGYRDWRREDIAVRAGQELDLGAIYLDPVPTLRVHVTDAKTSAPIAGARVRLRAEQKGGHMEFRRSLSVSADEGVESIEFGDSHSATTDAAGWAVLTSLEGETVELSARAELYAPGKLGGIVLPKGESLEQELRLTRGGEVLVRVLDAQGQPLAGARVDHRAESDGGPEGGTFVLGGPRPGGAVTDSEGQVVFENLAVGLHSFRLGEEGGGGPVFATMDTVMITGMDAGGDDWSQVQVVEGERAELTLRAAPIASLTGRVREAGKILPGATLRLSREKPEDEARMPMLPGFGGGGGPEAKSDGEGRFRFDDVKEGRYTVVVEHPTRRMPQEFPLELREGENTFDVDLPLAVLSGRVLDVDRKPLAGVEVWPERKQPSGERAMMAVRMVIADDGGGGGVIESGQFGSKARTDAEGRYTLRGVTSDVDLVVKAEGESVQPGQSETVRLAPNEVKEGVDLTLEAAGSIRVEAKLADGSPARFQLVQAEFLGEADPPLRPAFGFLQQGSTELKGLKPGRWRVNVRKAQGGPGNGDPGQDKEVEVEAGVQASAAFEVD
jgi:protocatechuate 3,4-dioxygenase beta subunit